MKRTKEESLQALNQWIEDTNVVCGDEIVNENQEQIDVLKELIKDAYDHNENDHDFDWYKHEYFAMCDLYEEKNNLDDLPKKLDRMRHALGIKLRTFKKNQDNYTCYRNSFVVKSEDPYWEDLCTEGLASAKHQEDQIIYSVTDKGRILLGLIYEKFFNLE